MSLLKDVEGIAAHFAIQGFTPCKLRTGSMTVNAITNGRQTFYVKWNKVHMASVVMANGQSPASPLEWWQISDTNMRKLLQHIDPSACGGFTGD
jgi:hypothetical protein